MNRILSAFLILIIFSSYEAVVTNQHFSSCSGTGQTTGTIDTLDIHPCSRGRDPNICQLKRNTTVSISVNITSHVNTTGVKTFVYGIIPGGPLQVLLELVHLGKDGIRFLGVEEDACKHNVDHCNIFKGETIQYTNALEISNKYPLLTLRIKWIIRDDKNNDLACIIIPAEIIQ